MKITPIFLDHPLLIIYDIHLKLLIGHLKIFIEKTLLGQEIIHLCIELLNIYSQIDVNLDCLMIFLSDVLGSETLGFVKGFLLVSILMYYSLFFQLFLILLGGAIILRLFGEK